MDKTGNGCNGFYLYVLYTNRYLFNLQDKDREAAGPRQPPLASTHWPLNTRARSLGTLSLPRQPPHTGLNQSPEPRHAVLIEAASFDFYTLASIIAQSLDTPASPVQPQTQDSLGVGSLQPYSLEAHSLSLYWPQHDATCNDDSSTYSSVYTADVLTMVTRRSVYLPIMAY